ncbi:hypothetical protein BTM25_12280 [Actinomadura rubteroloni]|uniref:WXG100 family type VII secretion target n=1 Tax=Actinomadura rubteroloni TaxID=1926885 RepID=A0A2P4UP41_9ACTN|nr:hypothetical protein [Actinomadura rubteroloni]POM26820.1 hypothetical protein BTM25_12280 [Actinomadura rubteroloni]
MGLTENPGSFNYNPGNWNATKAVDGNAPIWSQGHKAFNHAGDGDFGSVAGDIADLGMTGLAIWADPLNALISAGLGFLIDWCEPLKSAITWVTGNAGAIEDYRKNWKEIQDKLVSMSNDLQTSLSGNLGSWKGTAGDAARKRLGEFQEGVQRTIGEVGDVMSTLALSGGLMDAALDVVKGILSEFVEWLILTWLAAQAAAVPTLGASEAAAAGATAGEAAIATSRAMSVIQKVTRIFKKLMEIMAKVRASVAKIGAKAYRPLAYEARHAGSLGKLPKMDGLREAARAASGKGIRDFPGQVKPQSPRDVLEDVAPLIIKGGGGGAQAAQDGNPIEVPSSEEINRLLNPNA